MKIDTRLHVAVTSKRFLLGGHAVLADKTMYIFEATAYRGNTYYWTIANAKSLLKILRDLVTTTTITQPDPSLLTEAEVVELIHDLEDGLSAKQVKV